MELKPVSPTTPATQPVVVDTPKSSIVEKVARVVVAMGLFAALGAILVYLAPTFPMTVTIIAAVSLPLVVWGLLDHIGDFMKAR